MNFTCLILLISLAAGVFYPAGLKEPHYGLEVTSEDEKGKYGSDHSAGMWDWYHGISLFS